MDDCFISLHLTDLQRICNIPFCSLSKCNACTFLTNATSAFNLPLSNCNTCILLPLWKHNKVEQPSAATGRSRQLIGAEHTDDYRDCWPVTTLRRNALSRPDRPFLSMGWALESTWAGTGGSGLARAHYTENEVQGILNGQDALVPSSPYEITISNNTEQ